MSLRGARAGPAPAVAGLQFVVVRAADGNFALPSDVVRGIVPLEDGGGGQSLSYQGEDLPLRNLAGRFGWSSRPPASGTRVILCGAQETVRAFIVDEVCGLSEVPPTAVRPLPPHFAGPERGWFSGLFLYRDAVALVVQPGWLLGLVAGAPVLLPADPPPSVEQAAPAAQPAATVVEAVPVTPSRPAPVAPVVQVEAGAGPDVIQLEEASDAEDTPWAEL